MSRKCTSELRVRLTDVEYMQIQNNAVMCGLTISDYVRKLIREEPQLQKPGQDAIAHFRSLQLFKSDLEAVLAELPVKKQEHITHMMEKLLLEGKRMI